MCAKSVSPKIILLGSFDAVSEEASGKVSEMRPSLYLSACSRSPVFPVSTSSRKPAAKRTQSCSCHFNLRPAPIHARALLPSSCPSWRKIEPSSVSGPIADNTCLYRMETSGRWKKEGGKEDMPAIDFFAELWRPVLGGPSFFRSC
jgi:hypothetical protein